MSQEMGSCAKMAQNSTPGVICVGLWNTLIFIYYTVSFLAELSTTKF